MKPLSDGLRKAWRNSQDINDDDSSDQDVSLAPCGSAVTASSVATLPADLSSARSCIDLRRHQRENGSNGDPKLEDRSATMLRPHMRSTADLFRFTTV